MWSMCKTINKLNNDSWLDSGQTSRVSSSCASGPPITFSNGRNFVLWWMCNSFNVKCNWKRPKKTKNSFWSEVNICGPPCLVLEYTITVSRCRNRQWLRVHELSVNHMMTRVVVIESLERGEPGNNTGRVWSHCDHQVVTTAEICCHQWDPRSSKITSVAMKYNCYVRSSLTTRQLQRDHTLPLCKGCGLWDWVSILCRSPRLATVDAKKWLWV